MIPRAAITAWRGTVPWLDDSQVEQDLVISRALVEVFNEPGVADRLVLRGGTALHKLLLSTPARYSEDIDLVQRDIGPVGKILDALRRRLDPWLGNPRRDRGPGIVTITYRFDSEAMPVRPLRLKIEINVREHFSVLGIQKRRFVVDNPWFRQESEVTVYPIDEILGTKLRALYQRKKGRDLFDLWLRLDRGLVDAEAVIECFRRYMLHGGTPVSRAEFEANLAAKARDAAFHEDVRRLVAAGVSYDPQDAIVAVRRDLVARLPGEPWKGGEQARA
ncbi:MAG: nucleotidyl transferase AbiEii/AbiGii toxin family protein [Planctomycetes bacterium]|nr:nucleotidyl transferase AbiEii/AbiGii toxin family protein [Planctomycetota bacterium]